LRITPPQATSTPATSKSESSSSYFGFGTKIRSAATALSNPFKAKPDHSERNSGDIEDPLPIPGTYSQPAHNPWDESNSDYTHIYPVLGGYPPKSQQEKEKDKQEKEL